ncbi:hypothetical protein LINGRAHAP2_LOCUS7869 [Linum grandiflorum]
MLGHSGINLKHEKGIEAILERFREQFTISVITPCLEVRLIQGRLHWKACEILYNFDENFESKMKKNKLHAVHFYLKSSQRKIGCTLCTSARRAPLRSQNFQNKY